MALLQACIPQITITKIMGALARSKHQRFSQWAIGKFIRHFKVDMQEAIDENPLNYADFNSFFIRQLKPHARPIDANTLSIVSPADGTLSASGTLTNGQLLQAKGQSYSLHALLADNQLKSEPFIDGHYFTIYLSPKDYHRVHCPVDAKVTGMTFVPGKLFSVAPSTVKHVDGLFTRNERLVISLETKFGSMALIMVGAMIVSGLHTNWHGDICREKELHRWRYPNPKTPTPELKKGQELGHFKMGSTVILLCSKDFIEKCEPMSTASSLKMGQALGYAKNTG